MAGVGLFGAVVVGLLAGWIADRLLGRRRSLLFDLASGLAGGLFGDLLLGAAGVGPPASLLSRLIVAILGVLTIEGAAHLIRWPWRPPK